MTPGGRGAALAWLTAAWCAACGTDQPESSAALTGGGLASDGTTGAQPLDATRSGEGTYYAATGAGACLFDTSPDALRVAAINAPEWAESALCGACAAVKGPSGTVAVRIVDLCPECAQGDLDLSLEAFERIAERELGRVPIEWSLVPCDVVGPIAYRYKDGANDFWTAIQVHNHRLPIARVEWSKEGGPWQPMVRQDYNYFLTETGFGAGPTVVRVTASDGQQLVDTLPAVEAERVVSGQGQFE